MYLQALVLPPSKRVWGVEQRAAEDVAVGEDGEGGAAPMSDNEVSRLVGTSDKEHLEVRTRTLVSSFEITRCRMCGRTQRDAIP